MATHVILKTSQVVIKGLQLGPWNYSEKGTGIRSSQIIRVFFFRDESFDQQHM